ncbi:hypothetical protein F5146DRAFT_645873 [Armillaria mellea]|nr:hypothetical protein F5146DRAFT_645873 [Armillaria mellea]
MEGLRRSKKCASEGISSGGLGATAEFQEGTTTGATNATFCLNHSMARCQIRTISTFLALPICFILSRFLTFPRATSGANTMSRPFSVKGQMAYMLCASPIAYIFLHPHP